MERVLGILVPEIHESDPPEPEQWPLGRGALAAEADGIPCVFGSRLEGGRIWGHRPIPGGWRRVEGARVAALHNRFLSFCTTPAFASLMRAAGEVPTGNPRSLSLLCRDKLECQRHLEGLGVPMPEVEGDGALFGQAVHRWGAAFVKPRYGAKGRGVMQVHPGGDIPLTGPGARPGEVEPTILQRAVPPPPGWAGVSVRLLAQRSPPSEGGDGSFVIVSRVLRRSRVDPVVNVARGAEAVPGEEALSAQALERLDRRARAVWQALGGHPDGRWLVELGIDLVQGADGDFHLVEVNTRPRGRLEALASADAAGYWQAHVSACARPLRYLAWAAGLVA